MQAVTTVGLDIAKWFFQTYGVDAACILKLPPCLIGIEACAEMGVILGPAPRDCTLCLRHAVVILLVGVAEPVFAPICCNGGPIRESPRATQFKSNSTL
jgi:hypothetical protein